MEFIAQIPLWHNGSTAQLLEPLHAIAAPAAIPIAQAASHIDHTAVVPIVAIAGATRNVDDVTVLKSKFKWAGIMIVKKLRYLLEEHVAAEQKEESLSAGAKQKPIFFEVGDETCTELCEFMSKKDDFDLTWLERNIRCAMQVETAPEGESVQGRHAVYAAILPARGPEQCRQKHCIMIFAAYVRECEAEQ